MKHREQMSQRELLIRLDERMEVVQGAIPKLYKKVSSHDRDILIAKVLGVILVIIIGIKYPVIAEAIARVFP